jgi:hypothetical protein
MFPFFWTRTGVFLNSDRRCEWAVSSMILFADAIMPSRVNVLPVFADRRNYRTTNGVISTSGDVFCWEYLIGSQNKLVSLQCHGWLTSLLSPTKLQLQLSALLAVFGVWIYFVATNVVALCKSLENLILPLVLFPFFDQH